MEAVARVWCGQALQLVIACPFQTQKNQETMKTLIETLPRATFAKPERLLVCLLMSLLSSASRAQAPVELTSITSTTNGVRVAWTDPGPGQAYTIQVRESLTSGAWRNGAMRYRWPWPYRHWADAPRSLPASRYYPKFHG
jgi:hypothetical protein